jgi:Protein of unknown function (DUF2795)
MERGSDKHGPRLDDELEHEVRGLLQGQTNDGRVEEWHDPEPAGEDQPEVGDFPDPGDDLPGGAPSGITAAEADRRARFASYLNRSLFPADRAKLRAAAGAANAPDDVLAVIDRLPDGEFVNMAEAWQAAGGGIESQRW